MKRLMFGNLLAVCLLVVTSAAWAEGIGCGQLTNAYGPYDYTDPFDFKMRLPIVETNHFRPDQENLIKGLSTYLVGGDLDYTLRAFPNHHRALHAMGRYQLREKGLAGANYSADCYFERGIRFKPSDPVVYQVYGIYLHKKGALAESLQRYQQALKLTPMSVELNYNMGLLYVDLKDYAAARAHAKKAYQGGYPLAGLRNRLKDLGQWDSAELTSAVTSGKPKKSVSN